MAHRGLVARAVVLVKNHQGPLPKPKTRLEKSHRVKKNTHRAIRVQVEAGLPPLPHTSQTLWAPFPPAPRSRTPRQLSLARTPVQGPPTCGAGVHNPLCSLHGRVLESFEPI